jgi:hypothetical protein
VELGVLLESELHPSLIATTDRVPSTEKHQGRVGEDLVEWDPRVAEGRPIMVVARNSERQLEPEWDL